MNIRKVTSLTALISFLFTLFTSIILYVVPEGRVAYWSDWHLLGLTKTQWGHIHINLGFLFILSILVHIYYNWNPILNYLKNKQKKLKIVTPDFNAALGIVILVVLSTFFMIPPFSTILDLSAKIKNNAAQKYGEPPFGHAELSSLKGLVKKMGLDYDDSVAKLKKAGVSVDHPDQIFLEIAKKQGMTPKAVYDLMTHDEGDNGKKALPALPPPGMGNKTFAGLCSEYQLNPEKIVKILESDGMTLESSNRTMKEIAALNKTTPMALYDRIKEITESEEK